MIKIQIDIDKQKLAVWIKKRYPSLGIAHLQKLCRVGEIRINGGRCKPLDYLSAGDELKLPPYIEEYKGTPTKVSEEDVILIQNSVIFETPSFIAINKPAGIATQGGSGQTRHIDAIMNEAFPKFAGSLRLVHRLDLETSGVLLIAKSLAAAQEITAKFKSRDVGKTYLALVYGVPVDKMGKIDSPIVDEDGTEKKALTFYEVLDEAFGTISLIQFTPKSGRTHQLRIHAKHIGHPIVGDFKYGKEGQFAKLRGSLGDFALGRNLMLHAHRLEMPEERAIAAEPPEHFRKLCKYLNFDIPSKGSSVKTPKIRQSYVGVGRKEPSGKPRNDGKAGLPRFARNDKGTRKDGKAGLPRFARNDKGRR